jgi:predicted DNA-binding antitoxin AbrB/MazE fold protein
MTITVEAVYENGVLKPTQPLPLAERETVEVVVRTPAEIPATLDAVRRSYGILGWKGTHENLEQILAEADEDLE